MGWGRVYLNCLYSLRLLANPPLRAGLFKLSVFFKAVGEPAPTGCVRMVFLVVWGRVYLNCLYSLRLLANPPLRDGGNGIIL